MIHGFIATDTILSKLV